MKLYLLTRIGGASYEEDAGMVIRARTAKEARQIAVAHQELMTEWGAGQPRIWADPELVTVVHLTAHGDPGIVLIDNTGA